MLRRAKSLTETVASVLRERTLRLLQEYGLRPNKRLGQNFLVDAGVARDIVAAAELSDTDRVLEIGAGLGALTELLARECEHVIALEADRGLCRTLRDLIHSENVQVIEADFLRISLPLFMPGARSRPWKVVGNLPYCITSPIIEKLLRHSHLMSRCVLTVQKEVADRLRARPGDPEYGSLTVFVGYYAAVRHVRDIPPQAFYPAPEVQSEAILLETRPPSDRPDCPPEAFEAVVRAAFGQRRKMLRGSVGRSRRLGLPRDVMQSVFEQAGIDPTRRAETLSVEEFAALGRAVAAAASQPSQ
ncbi:MAG: 16S rRNA (adenine(1518)-N(6)/adenine(1519)-N(6))-dimethyltransferase RsmA [Armatimonadota bacterium]